MRLYLVRHGDATRAEENPRRPLSAKGRGEVERMASFLARSGVRPRRVIHSGKLRAGETAAILARALAPGLMLEESEGLGPEDSPDKLIAAANAWAEAALDGRGGAGAAASDALIVGHMPFMARALAALVGADAAPEFAAFASGAVACLEMDEGRWRLLWLVAPELLGG